jgi:hypothetical protein
MYFTHTTAQRKRVVSSVHPHCMQLRCRTRCAKCRRCHNIGSRCRHRGDGSFTTTTVSSRRKTLINFSASQKAPSPDLWRQYAGAGYIRFRRFFARAPSSAPSPPLFTDHQNFVVRPTTPSGKRVYRPPAVASVFRLCSACGCTVSFIRSTSQRYLSSFQSLGFDCNVKWLACCHDQDPDARKSRVHVVKVHCTSE